MKKIFIGSVLIVSFFLTSFVPNANAMHQGFIHFGDICRDANGQPMVDISTGQVATCESGTVCKQGTHPQGGQGTWFCQRGSSVNNVFGQIVPPLSIINIGYGSQGVSRIVNVFITLIYTVASILFIFMLLISALQWIMSGGDKEAIGKARGRLVYAIIGIVVLAFAFVIARIVGGITGFEFFAG